MYEHSISRCGCTCTRV